MGKVGRDLQAHDAVDAGLLVDWAQRIGGAPDVLHRQPLVDGGHVHRGIFRQERGDGVVVLVAPADGLLEDGGVGGEAAEGVLLHEPLKLAALHETAADVVEPEGLALGADGAGRGVGSLGGRHGTGSACSCGNDRANCVDVPGGMRPCVAAKVSSIDAQNALRPRCGWGPSPYPRVNVWPTTVLSDVVSGTALSSRTEEQRYAAFLIPKGRLSRHDGPVVIRVCNQKQRLRRRRDRCDRATTRGCGEPA